ncbi:MAG: DNA repair protein RadC [Pedobacter sp.]|nr:MAG: DNA repair protein RadC [Pedobacter sp.]
MDDYVQKLKIKNWAEADRPREKLLEQGRRALTDAELIALIIRSGSTDETAVDLSKRMLRSYQNDLSILAKVGVKEFSKFKGMGLAKAMGIVAALEIGRRRSDTDIEVILPKVSCSKDAYAIFKSQFIDLAHEEFWILLLNRANRVILKQNVSRGGQSMTVVDPKIIFKIALEQNAAAMILGHNHPSGNLTPSLADINMTNKLVEAGRLLELPVLDHLILTDRHFLSMADEDIVKFKPQVLAAQSPHF